MNQTYVIEKGGKYSDKTKQYETLRWVLRAAAKNGDPHEVLTMLHIENGIHVATDGHRLHMASMETELPDGNYKALSNTVKLIILEKQPDEIEYVPFWNILSYQPVNGIKPFDASYSNNHNFSSFVRHIYLNSEKAFHLDYLKDAYFEGGLRFESAGADYFKPFIFGNENQIAVIMPYDPGRF